MKWFVLSLWAALSLTRAAMGQAQAPDLRAALVTDTVVDPAAWNFPDGKWGTTVNGQTFQQEAVLSHRGYQYAAFFADGGVLSLARRKLPDGAWDVIRFGDYTARDHRDTHNTVSMGLCAGDGTIHLAFDHHNDPLHYRRSVAGLASDPDRFEWKAEHFGSVTSKLEDGQALSNVTYPQFFSTPQQKLQMLYRVGSSGDGDWYLVEYDPAGGTDGAWSTLGVVLSGQGQYKTSPSRCAYPNPPRYGSDSRLHLTWCWRERPADAPFDLRTNHDLLYACSDDFGRTWRNNDGDTLAVLGPGHPGRAGHPGEAGMASTIAIDSPGTIARPTRWLWGQMNTTTQYVDRLGRVHVLNWQQPPEAPQSSKDLNTWRYVHYWRDTDGAWHENPLPFRGRKPQIVLDDAGNAIVVYVRGQDGNYHGQDPGGYLQITAATEASGWTDWRTLWAADHASVGEPLLDHARWAVEQVLSVYLQDKPTQPGAPSPLRVTDFVIPTAVNHRP